jgi:hypothetical protein
MNPFDRSVAKSRDYRKLQFLTIVQGNDESLRIESALTGVTQQGIERCKEKSSLIFKSYLDSLGVNQESLVSI